MDEETRRYYDSLTRILRSEYPWQKTFTADEIGYVSVSEWSEKRREMETMREGAIEAARATMSDPAQRTEAESKFAEYYDRRRDTFDQQIFAATDQIYRDNGISSVPELSGPRQEPLGQRPEFLTEPPSRPMQQGDRPTTRFHNGREALPGPHDSPAISGERQGERGDAKPLTPKLEHTPPLHFRQQFAPSPNGTMRAGRSPYFTGPVETFKQYAIRAQATEPEHKDPKSPGPAKEPPEIEP